MVLIPGGEFDMGDVLGDREKHDETVHAVHVDDFYLGKTELTFAEYDAFCSAVGKPCPVDSSWGRGTRPVMHVSWYDAVAYCNWLSEQQNLGKVYTILGDSVIADWRADGYRLPTEAEWEYACRAGSTTEFHYGPSLLCNQARFSLSFHSSPPAVCVNPSGPFPVGSYAPNAWGLYDMHGNVWEWCMDSWSSYTASAKTDPYVSGGPGRVIRGGGWNFYSYYCRSAYRYFYYPGNATGSNGGFRVVLAPVLVP